MQDNHLHIEVLEQLAAGVDPATGEVFPPDSPYQQAAVIRAVCFAIDKIKGVAQMENMDSHGQKKKKDFC